MNGHDYEIDAGFAERRRLALQFARELTVDDVDWMVYELPPAPLDRRSSPCLVFESREAIRVVRQYPSEWRDLTQEALYGVSLRR